MDLAKRTHNFTIETFVRFPMLYCCWLVRAEMLLSARCLKYFKIHDDNVDGMVHSS